MMSDSIRRIWAILLKEFIHMKRDRLTLAMLIGIPVMQLLLFGYAINTNPKHLPTAIHIEQETDITRGIRAALINSDYFQITKEFSDIREADALLRSGKVNFIISIPQNFSKNIVNSPSQAKPAILMQTDGTDPMAVAAATAQLPNIIQSALRPFTQDARGISLSEMPLDVVVHNVYNPEGITQWNIIPGLLGIILTMTTVMITAITMTRENERGTMENLLAMPARPFEVMIGKIIPYIGMGAVQTILILVVGKYFFQVPFEGNWFLQILGIVLFLLSCLTLGFTFSTIAKSQLQAVQMTFFFFLPSILLSGFMFPFRGMPVWAQYIGEILPLTHFLRIVRGVMLKDAGFSMLWSDYMAIGIFWLATGSIAMLRYKRTLN